MGLSGVGYGAYGAWGKPFGLNALPQNFSAGVGTAATSDTSKTLEELAKKYPFSKDLPKLLNAIISGDNEQLINEQPWLLDYALLVLTRFPGEITQADVDSLRDEINGDVPAFVKNILSWAAEKDASSLIRSPYPATMLIPLLEKMRGQQMSVRVDWVLASFDPKDNADLYQNMVKSDPGYFVKIWQIHPEWLGNNIDRAGILLGHAMREAFAQGTFESDDYKNLPQALQHTQGAVSAALAIGEMDANNIPNQFRHDIDILSDLIASRPEEIADQSIPMDIQMVLLAKYPKSAPQLFAAWRNSPNTMPKGNVLAPYLKISPLLFVLFTKEERSTSAMLAMAQKAGWHYSAIDEAMVLDLGANGSASKQLYESMYARLEENIGFRRETDSDGDRIVVDIEESVLFDPAARVVNPYDIMVHKQNKTQQVLDDVAPPENIRGAGETASTPVKPVFLAGLGLLAEPYPSQAWTGGEGTVEPRVHYGLSANGLMRFPKAQLSLGVAGMYGTSVLQTAATRNWWAEPTTDAAVLFNNVPSANVMIDIKPSVGIHPKRTDYRLYLGLDLALTYRSYAAQSAMNNIYGQSYRFDEAQLWLLSYAGSGQLVLNAEQRWQPYLDLQVGGMVTVSQRSGTDNASDMYNALIYGMFGRVSLGMQLQIGSPKP